MPSLSPRRTSSRRIGGRRMVAVAAVAGAALCVAACGSSSGSPTTTAAAGGVSAVASNAPVTLRLGYLTNLTHAAALVGVQDGYFKQSLPSNVTLQTATYNAGPAEVTALLAGSLDAAYMGPNSAINAYTQGKGAIRIISGATSGGAALVVSPSITSSSQLKGKTIATPQLGNTQDVALRTWLKKQGLTFPGPNGGSGDVTILPEDNATTLTSFEAGTIAGAWVPEPWASRLVTEGGGKVLVDEKSLWPQGAFVTTHLIVSTDFLAKYPGTVTKLLEAEAATLDTVKADPAKAKTTANEALKALTGKTLAPAVLDRAFDNLTLTLDPIASTLQVSADHGVEVGTTKKADLSGIYDLTLLNALLKQRGEQPVSAAGLGKE